MNNDSDKSITEAAPKVNRNKGNSQKVFAVMTHYSKKENYPLPIVVPNYLIHYTDDASKALFLAQLIYWNDRPQRDDGYFWKSKGDWYKEIGIKKKSLERYEQEFVQAGFLDIRLIKAYGHPTNHYKLDLNKLLDCIINTLRYKGMAVTNETAKKSIANANKA